MNEKQKDIIIGCDGRLSSPDFLDALSFGLQETGCNVINLGEITSPMLYYAISKMDPKSGVMITGSHNPASYNGLKVIIDNVRISEDSILNLYERIKEGNFVQGRGTEENTDIINEYIDFIVSCVSLKRHLKVVLDCANGVGSKTAPKVFKALGCEVIELFCEVDGTFPNHHPDPLVEENMQDLILEVQKQKADVGFAFDGDADRVGVVSSAGEIIWPDRQMILFVRDILSRNKGAVIPFDVKCTRHLSLEIEKNGGVPSMGRTGHSLLHARVHEFNSPLGGELSGHFFFNDTWPGFDDGVYAATRFAELLSKYDTNEEVFSSIPNTVNTPELKLEIDDEKKYHFMDKFLKEAVFSDAKINTIDGIRVDFSDGFGLVRASNTTPCLTLRFEGDSKEALERIKNLFRKEFNKIDNSLKLPF